MGAPPKKSVFPLAPKFVLFFPLFFFQENELKTPSDSVSKHSTRAPHRSGGNHPTPRGRKEWDHPPLKNSPCREGRAQKHALQHPDAPWTSPAHRAVAKGCHGPRSYVCQAPNTFLYVCQALPPIQTPNAFICVSPNASAESATELASLAHLCSLRSHFF